MITEAHIKQLIAAVREAGDKHAAAIVFAAAYTANHGNAPLSKAGEAVDHFKQHCL